MSLSTLAPGMRANATDLGPTAGERMGNREFQLNIDGQELSVGSPTCRRRPSVAFGQCRSPFSPISGATTDIRQTTSVTARR